MGLFCDRDSTNPASRNQRPEQAFGGGSFALLTRYRGKVLVEWDQGLVVVVGLRHLSVLDW